MILKFTVLLGAFLAYVSLSFAQTNSFPSSGDVKVGFSSKSNLLMTKARGGNTNGVISFRDTDSPMSPHAFWLIDSPTNGGMLGGISNTASYNASPDNGLYFTPGYNGNWNDWVAKFAIKSDGSVGIGTNSPQAKLDVKISSRSNLLIAAKPRGGNTDGVISFRDTNSPMRPHAFWLIDSPTNGGMLGGISNTASYSASPDNGLYFTPGYNGNWDDWVAKFAIKSDGNVGIGTTSPQAKLDIKLDDESSLRIGKGFVGVDGVGGISFRDNVSNNHVNKQAIWLVDAPDNGGMLGGITNSYAYDKKSDYGIYIVPGAENKWRTWKAKLAVKHDGVGIGIDKPDAMLSICNVGDSDNTKILGFGEGNNSGIWFQSGFSASDGNNYIQLRSALGNAMTWKLDGNVGIGTTSPTAKLTVAGGIYAQEVKVTTNAGADFVFEEDYTLRSLADLDQFVKENKHLPEIAPAAQMVAEGVDMGQFQIQLLQKVEELTLYVINQEKKITDQQAKITQLENAIKNR